MERPWLFRFTQALAAPGADARLRRMIADWVAAHSEPGRCLDVGCGPRSWLQRAGWDAYGIDSSSEFIADFRRRGGQAEVGCATALPFAEGAFDSVWSFGLLHHLPDDAARRAVEEMQRVTRVGGWTVVFDAVLPRSTWRSPLAALLRRIDRGAWMRSEGAFSTMLPHVRDWECERLKYSLTGLEGLLATFRKTC